MASRATVSREMDPVAPQLLKPHGVSRAYAVVTVALVAMDACVLLAALWAAYHLRFCPDSGGTCLGLTPVLERPTLYAKVVGLYLATTLVLLWSYGAYARQNLFGGLRQYTACLHALLLATLMVVFSGYLLSRSASISRGFLLMSCLLGAVLLCTSRFFARRVLFRLRGRRVLVERAVIVGTSTEAQLLEWTLRRQPGLGYVVMGFIDNKPPGTPVQAGLTILGTVAHLGQIVEALQVSQILVARSSLSHDETLHTLQQAAATNADVALSTDYFQVLATGARLIDITGIPLLAIEKVRLTGGNRLLKRTLDLALALSALVILSPLLVTVALVIRSRMGSPVLDRLPALGPRGTTFFALKFRTTTQGESAALSVPEVQARLARGLPLREFPDVTPLGRHLRRYSLDELPQLVNILRGEMSMVGPYKIHPTQASLYGRRSLMVTAMKPGITGIAQVSGRGELTPEERAILDADYVRTYTVWRDVIILLRTVRVVIKARGAY